MNEKNPVLEQEDAKTCSECKYLFFEGYWRCSLFGDPILDDIEEKNCES